MNAFLSILEANSISRDSCLHRTKLTTVQVNMGNMCNQECSHCHVDASRKGEEVMSRKVVDEVLKFLLRNKGLIFDVTGGAPELNPNFEYLVTNARALVEDLIVRTNLTVIFEPGKEGLPQFYKKHKIHLVCSLPGYEKADVDRQRGMGVFDKSVKALRILNDIGYSKSEGLTLDLVYNPAGAELPTKKDTLEKVYKFHLRGNYKIDFNKFIPITNVPIKRFKGYLDSRGQYHGYLKLLGDNFNKETVKGIMCREFLSVGYDARLYDCDFNQALGWALKDEDGNFLTIAEIDIQDLEGRQVMCGEHCLSCTAGWGSSCQGPLVSDDTDEQAFRAREGVKAYYGKTLKGRNDLKTDACCAIEPVPDRYRDILSNIHPEVLSKFYGCGSPIPPLLEGCSILDLGCGTGRDSYLVCALAGPNGLVKGVDMTDEQLEVARRYTDYHAKKFGFSKPNIEFKRGYIEDLKEIGIEDGSVDVIISNCTINLSPHKSRVFSEVFRVLKPGGELYFSDVFTGRRIPEHLKADPLLYAECLGGALYIEDFRRILRRVGCPDYRVVSKRRIALSNKEIEEKAGMVDFYSITIRAFKLDDLEDICEDYGQSAVYLGTILHNPHKFALDDHHIFIAGKPMLVCGNTASMLWKTRYAKHFKITGDRSVHYGPFNCAPASVKVGDEDDNAGGVCC